MSTSTEYIVSNQIECLKCGDKPFSMNRHDYSECKCGAVAVDGGQDYLRRVGQWGCYRDISIVVNKEDFFSLVADIDTSVNSGRTPLGIACAVLRSLRDLGYEGKEKPSE